MIKLFFDGYCLTNPDIKGSYGVIVYKDNETIKTISDNFGGRLISNNVAEYMGLLKGLKFLLNNNYEYEEIEVYGDSKLVIMQMSNLWRIKKGLYKDIALETKDFIKRFKNITFKWIPREENIEADELAKPRLQDERTLINVC